MYAYSNNGLSFRSVGGGVATCKPAAGNAGNGSPLPIVLGAGAEIGAYTLTLTSDIAFSISDPTGVLVGTGAVGAPFSASGLSFTLLPGPEPFAEKDSLTITVVELPYVAAAGEVVFAGIATPAQLTAAFPGFPAALAASQATQQAEAAFAGGITITSTSTPALNGTYACDETMQARITAISTSLAAGKGFPHGATTFAWPDVAGNPHTFTEPNFLAFASAVESYVSDVLATEAALFARQSAVFPSATVTIP